MRNRWLIALAAIGIHICIGSVYAWSVLTRPIMEQLGFTLKQTTWTFSLAILFLGLSAGFLGSFVEKYGPRKSGLVSMCFFGTGMFGTAFALSVHSLPLLYLFYGVIGGIGLGVGYITPVSTLVKYFPNHRGFATGLAIMGFGFAALIAGPLMQYLTATYGLVTNFLILGGVYMTIMGMSALYLKPPAAPAAAKNAIRHIVNGFTANEAVKTWQFGALWWVFFVNITCGIGLLAVASPMAQDVVKMSPAAAASMVGIIGLLNGFGRIAWSTVSDYLGRGWTYAVFFIIEIAAFWKLAATTDEFLFQALVLLIPLRRMGFTYRPTFGFRGVGLGTASVVSFHATKLVQSLEGGAILTPDRDLAARLRQVERDILAHDDVAAAAVDGVAGPQHDAGRPLAVAAATCFP